MIDAIALPRGAALLAEAAEGARSFALGFWFPIGSRHEAPRERGFAHFVEHLLFKGTASRDALTIAREIDRVGGYLNAFTERDLLCLHCAVPAARWRLALELLVDLSFSSSFPPEEVEREREVIASEILAARDEPEEASHDRFIELLWPGHPLSRKIAGEPEDVEAAGREELYAFYRGHLRPERLLVSAAGPVKPELIREELSALLEGLPEASAPARALPEEMPPRFEAVRRLEPAPLSQLYLYEALPLEPPFAPEDYYALSVLNGALGESMSSRLFQGLREREGLCYSVYSAFSLGRGEGLWLAQASSSARSFPRLVAELDRELDALAAGGGFSDEEVAESVSRIAGSFELALDDPEYRMRRLARERLYAGEVLDEAEMRARILSVDRARVDAMAARLFAGRERARFAYGRSSRAALAALGLPGPGGDREEAGGPAGPARGRAGRGGGRG